MTCTHSGSTVKDSRKLYDDEGFVVVRRRYCRSCGELFQTEEREIIATSNLIEADEKQRKLKKLDNFKGVNHDS